METLKDFNDSYISKTQAYYKRQENVRKQIRDLEAKKQRMRYPKFEKILSPIIETVKEKLGADSFEIMGPFGLSCETSVYWYKNKKTVGGLAFTSDGNGWAIQDESKELNRFPKNSIGAANGGNYAKIPIDETMDIDWLLKFVKQGY